MPVPARRVLDEGVFCHLAVRTRHGPHLTPMVFVFDGGRLWVTTARSSVKAAAWRRDRSVAGMVRRGDAVLSFRGAVRTYDALDPLSWPAAAAAGPRIVRAAARFSLKNARFFAGYAVDAGRVPLAWTPPGRVFAGIQLTAGRLIVAGKIEDGWGEWPTGLRVRRSFVDGGGHPGPDRGVPSAVREALGTRGEGALALQSDLGLTVVPAEWWRAAGGFDALLSPDLAELSGASGRAPAALTIDRASRWRAADMLGMLVQGPADLHALGDTSRGRTALARRLNGKVDLVLARIHPGRLVWWQGWSSGTVWAPVERRRK